MIVKRKHRRHRRHSTKNKKSTLRHRQSRKRSNGQSHKQTHKRKQYYMKGGNYETDITTRTLEGTATKPLNTIVVASPGYGTMSGTAYVNLMESIDRNGKRIYD